MRFVEDDQMPIDAEGNMADIKVDSSSIPGRMNLGRPQETFEAAASRDVANELRTWFGLRDPSVLGPDPEEFMRRDPEGFHKAAREIIPPEYRDSRSAFGYKKMPASFFYNKGVDLVDRAYEKLVWFFSLANPKQAQAYASVSDSKEKAEILSRALYEAPILLLPVDAPFDHPTVARNFRDNVKMVRGAVAYKSRNGRWITTRNPHRINPLYMIELEKIADGGSSISSSKVGHFGVPASSTRSEKISKPWKNTAVRTISETEGRLYSSILGVWAYAEMIDRSNNPVTRREIARRLLRDPNPSNIDLLINRDQIPYGGARAITIVKNSLACAGIRWAYTRDEGL